MTELLIRWLKLPTGEVDSVRLMAAAGQGRNILWWIAAAVLVALASSAAYARCRPTRRWMIVPLAGCRAAVLATIVLMLADVRAVVELVQQVRPAVWLLIDGSQSMSMAGDDRTDGSSATRLEQVRAAIGTGGLWLDRLQPSSDIEIFLEQAGSARRIGVLDGHLDRAALPPRLTADGQTTALGSAIERLSREPGGDRPAAAIVISDFNENAGPAITSAARRLGVPVYAIGVGPDRPSFELVLEARPAMRLSSQQQIGVLLKGAAAAAELHVRLWARPGEKGGGDAAAWDDASLIGEQQVRLTSASQRVDFMFLPEQRGPWLLHAEAEPSAAAAGKPVGVDRQVTVDDGAVRVLMVEHEPNWEWRSLERLLAADAATSAGLRIFLRSADSRIEKREGRYLSAPPTDLNELLEYDVVVIGDLPAASLNARFCESLRQFVTEAGGALIVVSGPRFGAGQLIKTAVGRLLPVDLQPAAEPIIAPFEPRPTADAERFSFARFGDNASGNANGSAWPASQATWYQPAADIRPGSVVLVEHPHDRCAQRPIRQPLIALGRAGRGEVLYLAFDETWRLRRAGDDSYREFWSGAVRHLANNRLAGREMVDAGLPGPTAVLGPEGLAIGCDSQLGRELARVTGGTYHALADVGQLADEVRPEPERRTSTHVVPLWSNWPVFIWIVGLLLSEWWLRKRAKLP